MDVTRILEADHRDVEALFTKIEGAEGAERQPFIDELASSLKAHMELEETIVYPVIEPIVGSEPVEEGDTEHDLARKTLEDVVALAPDQPGFGAALDSLKAGIEHHVNEEEDDVFPEVRTKGAKELEEMATPFMEKRVELGLPMTADGLSAAATRDELEAEATTAGIEGASGMKKDELAKALADSMA